MAQLLTHRPAPTFSYRASSTGHIHNVVHNTSRGLTVRVRAQAGDKMPKWVDVYDYLLSKQLRTVSPQEAQQLAASGDWVLVDVRPKAAYDEAHPEGFISAPLYQPIDNSNLDLAKMLKVIAYRFNGVTPIEPNPNFTQTIKDAAAGKTSWVHPQPACDQAICLQVGHVGRPTCQLQMDKVMELKHQHLLGQRCIIATLYKSRRVVLNSNGCQL